MFTTHIIKKISSRAIIAAVVLCAGCFSASAQVGDLRHNFAIGINGGVNLNSVSFEPTIKQNNLMGFTGGITARYISEKYFSMICGIQLELNYSQHGWEEALEDYEDTYSRTMNYIEIPMLAHIAFGKEQRGLRFFINAGPQIGFMLSESESYSEIWDPSHRIKEQYGKMVDKKFDYGIVGGAGVELRTKAGSFLLEGRYYFGLADFYNNTKKDYFSKSAHTAIQAKITYLFDLTNR